MTAIAERLDRKLKMKTWHPQTARDVKARVAEIIALADQGAFDQPVRDLPKSQIDRWLARDEAGMATFKATPKPKNR